MRKVASALWCANGERCVAYPVLGQPSKLSRGNPGPRCFACEERRVASELEAAAKKKSQVTERQKTNRRLNAGKESVCTKRSCERPAVARDGMAALVCREHAAVWSAAAVRERRRAWVLTCERALRSAIASDDKRLERKWARLLLEAEARLAWAEAELEAAEAKARSGFAR